MVDSQVTTLFFIASTTMNGIWMVASLPVLKPHVFGKRLFGYAHPSTGEVTRRLNMEGCMGRECKYTHRECNTRPNMRPHTGP